MRKLHPEPYPRLEKSYLSEEGMFDKNKGAWKILIQRDNVMVETFSWWKKGRDFYGNAREQKAHNLSFNDTFIVIWFKTQ